MKTDIYAPAPEHQDSRASSVFNLSGQHLKAASDAWVYALMSSNVYRDPEAPLYVIPGWEAAERWASPSGLAVEEWRKKDESGKLQEIAIVFQGTDFESLADWRTNFALIEPRQHREALAFVRSVVARPEAQGLRVVATGHSLGGALALNMSLRVPNVHFVGFNPSPRAFYGPEVKSDATRLWLYESGEALAFLRVPWYFKIQQYQPLRYNFLDFIFGRSVVSVEEHSMYLLSRGLLMAAVKHGDLQAARAFTANLNRPGFERLLASEREPAGAAHDVRECRRIFDRVVN